MGKNNKDVLILTLIVVIVLMIGVSAYLFLIKPALSGLVVEGQNQGMQQGVYTTVYAIMQQAATCNAVPLTLNNQTIHLVATECLAQMQQQIQQQAEAQA